MNSIWNNNISLFEKRFPQLAEQLDIKKIKEIMLRHNTVRTMMTGSGAAVFGIFTEKKSAEDACLELKDHFSFAGVYTNIID